ncbi:MAG: 1-deoxy-D-xylulose-5-phosphate synthase [Bacteroidales bacterium]|nr:1-deoxy-D-xylulose-5-phosphate synthase [Bacteroidales bacterium]
MSVSEQKLLQHIDSPEDLRKLPLNQLQQVCSELRSYIIDELSENPGHFAASLGVVELTVALHYVFHTPYDRIVWDVGHQAYGHKILTGRRNSFATNRQWGGISGFPNPSESNYDSFISGHASTSISAALGMAVASKLKEEPDRKVVAVIGDGSMTGGLAFEGLNNASSYPNNLLIILNDNDMAIDHVVGGLSKYLVHLTTSQTYNKLRYDVYSFLKKKNLLNDDNKESILRFNNSIKSLLTKQHTLFEGLNIRYFGPVDGHDVDGLVKILSDIKEMNGPKLLHIKTIKGKGFKPAEESPTEWHAPGRFDKVTAVRLKPKSNDSVPPLYQDVFGHTLVELAKMNDKIVGVTPAMPTGCSMSFLMEELPNRAFDVGIAEAHAVTFSAGLAKEGLMPFCNIYSSFMQRAYDQVIHDVALQKLDMVICLDRGGLVGEDGPTHHGAFDLAYLRCIPNLTVASPMNEHELRNLMFTGQQKGKGPFVIRYPRGGGVLVDWSNEMEELPVGKGRQIADGKELAILSLGPIGNVAKEVVKRLAEENVSVALYDMRYLKPIDEEILHEVGRHFTKIVTLEDGVIIGGFGSAVVEFMSDNHYAVEVKRIGLPDRFVEHGAVSKLYSVYGLDVEGIIKVVKTFSL